MRFTNIIRVALRALRRNLLRSMLTALGIIIGVGAVITMVSIGNGAESQVEAQVASLGQNIITAFPGSFSSGECAADSASRRRLPSRTPRPSSSEIENVDAVSPEVQRSQPGPRRTA
jgi:putative ABC transport system permease protein